MLLYYAFLNLVKAYVLTVGQQPDLDRAQHGIAEDKLPLGGQEFIDATVTVYPSTGPTPNIFEEFHRALTGTGLAGKTTFAIKHLVAQIVPGHRLWCAATGQRERFVSIEELGVYQATSPTVVWLRMLVGAEDIAVTGLTPTAFLQSARLDSEWRQVECSRPASIAFEQTIPVPVTHLELAVGSLVAGIRNSVWAVVTSTAPHRKYYLYSPPSPEDVLPDLLSLYAFVFYLGSATRYRPHHFIKILEGAFGAHVQEVISAAPAQFLYRMASRFAGRDVSRPALV